MIEIIATPHCTNTLHHDVSIYVNGYNAYYNMLTLEDIDELIESLYGQAASLTGYRYKKEKLINQKEAF